MLDVTCCTFNVCAVIAPVVVSDPVIATAPLMFCVPTKAFEPVFAKVRLSLLSNKSALDVYEADVATKANDDVVAFKANDDVVAFKA